MKKSNFAHIAFLLRPAEQETTIGSLRCRADTAPVDQLVNELPPPQAHTHPLPTEFMN
jgi:hypothetical protein